MYCKKDDMIFILHSKKSNNHENKVKILFNVSQLYSIPKFLRATF